MILADVASFERAVRRCVEEIKKWSLLFGDAILEGNEPALRQFVRECSSPFYRHMALTQLDRGL